MGALRELEPEVQLGGGHPATKRVTGQLFYVAAMNIYPWAEAPKKTCDRNSVSPLAIAVGNSDVRARGVYSTDAFLFTSYIYIHHSAYFYFYLIETEPKYYFKILFNYNHILTI